MFQVPSTKYFNLYQSCSLQDGMGVNPELFPTMEEFLKLHAERLRACEEKFKAAGSLLSLPGSGKREHTPNAIKAAPLAPSGKFCPPTLPKGKRQVTEHKQPKA